MAKLLRYISCVGMGLILGLSVTLYSKESTKSFDDHYTYPLLVDIIDTVETYYVQQVTKEELVQAAIQGIFDHLDPYSNYLSHQDLANLQDSNRGEYFGFGFEIATDDNKIKIVTPFAGSPAHQAGIQPGDQIVRFNEDDVTESNLAKILADIKNHSINNLPIALNIKRGNSDFDVSLMPSVISVKSVTAEVLKNNIGYIRLGSFQEDSTQDMMKQLSQWQLLPMEGIILDLRNNPGGLLDQAVQIADIFLDRGRIVSTEGRVFDSNSDYFASPQSMFSHVPMVVLINKGSASASEVLAAALKDNGRAVLLGEKSFGKGTVQSLIPTLVDGNAIKLTIAKYNTPKGIDIHSKGIEPDIKIAQEAVTELNNMSIIGNTSPHDDIAKDKIINSAIAWMETNN
ncbi:S41 family peptidase [Shewanella gelidii]|uniref:Carboxyl-terminal processing protease n=1 Tax=Shewanella gelidii TaxID=1642821 RepID=A0A917JWZ2_9GAMM|nr:S41 family peptidase [Shewanella gelidii]MCL1098967.1 S41 family peptidase [Shewanella gelidii]GGI90321.1 carboxyl-terminal processing protease [Shewanella gelidii]